MNSYESETQYLFNDAEKTVEASTLNTRTKEKFVKLAENNPEVIVLHQPEFQDDEMRITFPKSWLKIKPPRRFTDEEREVMRARGRELYEKFLARKQQEDTDGDIDASDVSEE